MTTTNKSFRVKNGLQIDPLTTPGFLVNDALGNITSTPALTDIKTYVKNNTGSTLYKGQAVYISGATGANALISLASSSSEATSSKTLGLLSQDLTTGSSGYVLTNGTLVGVDTSVWSEGDALWLDETPGALTVAHAVSPNHLVYIGVVTRSHAINGEILVKVQNGYELNELHNVLIDSPSNNQVLKYNSSSGLWENGSVGGSGTVTSVALTTPTGLSISGSPITSSGTLGLSLSSGYTIPLLTDITKGTDAYNWGNHSSVGYLTSYTETDPIFSASAASGITSTNISHWNSAYGWGDHSTAGYLTSAVTSIAGTLNQITASASTGSITLSLPTSVTMDTLNVTTLNVSGTQNIVDTTNLSITDSLIYLSSDQYNTDTVDIGIYGAYGDSNPGHFHTGFIRDASDGIWKLISGGSEPTTNVVDFSSATYDTIEAGKFKMHGKTSSDFLLGDGTTTTTPYTLPTASTSTLGGIKVDGSTITISNGVISAASSGGTPTISDTAPTSPTTGMLWLDSTNGRTYIRYDSYWIEQRSSKITPDENPSIYGTAYGRIDCGTSSTNNAIPLASVVGVTINTINGGTAVDF